MIKMKGKYILTLADFLENFDIYDYLLNVEKIATFIEPFRIWRGTDDIDSQSLYYHFKIILCNTGDKDLAEIFYITPGNKQKAFKPVEYSKLSPEYYWNVCHECIFGSRFNNAQEEIVQNIKKNASNRISLDKIYNLINNTEIPDTEKIRLFFLTAAGIMISKKESHDLDIDKLVEAYFNKKKNRAVNQIKYNNEKKCFTINATDDVLSFETIEYEKANKLLQDHNEKLVIRKILVVISNDKPNAQFIQLAPDSISATESIYYNHYINCCCIGDDPQKILFLFADINEFQENETEIIISKNVNGFNYKISNGRLRQNAVIDNASTLVEDNDWIAVLNDSNNRPLFLNERGEIYDINHAYCGDPKTMEGIINEARKIL